MSSRCSSPPANHPHPPQHATRKGQREEERTPARTATQKDPSNVTVTTTFDFGIICHTHTQKKWFQQLEEDLRSSEDEGEAVADR